MKAEQRGRDVVKVGENTCSLRVSSRCREGCWTLFFGQSGALGELSCNVVEMMWFLL